MSNDLVQLSPIVTSPTDVTAHERHHRYGHLGAVVWLTGLSGSGKSTLAKGIERKLFDRQRQVCLLDGDSLRSKLNEDLGFSHVDRTENIRRVAHVASLFAEAGFIAIVAVISPYQRDRLGARSRITSLTIPFIEIYLSTPIAECERRDPKGLYAKARSGVLRDFTGVSAPFERPADPAVVINTASIDLISAVDLVTDHVESQIAIPQTTSP